MDGLSSVLAAWSNEDITVTIKENDAPWELKLESGNYTVGAHANNDGPTVTTGLTISGEDITSNYVSLDTTNFQKTYAPGKIIAFKAAPSTGNEDNEFQAVNVKAWYVKDSEKTLAGNERELPVSLNAKVEGITGDNIWLFDLRGVDLTDETDHAKAVENNTGATVSVGTSGEFRFTNSSAETYDQVIKRNILGKTFTTNADKYSFVAKPEAGCRIKEIKATFHKVYIIGGAIAQETYVIDENGDRHKDSSGLYDFFTAAEVVDVKLNGQDEHRLLEGEAEYLKFTVSGSPSAAPTVKLYCEDTYTGVTVGADAGTKDSFTIPVSKLLANNVDKIKIKRAVVDVSVPLATDEKLEIGVTDGKFSLPVDTKRVISLGEGIKAAVEARVAQLNSSLDTPAERMSPQARRRAPIIC